MGIYHRPRYASCMIQAGWIWLSYGCTCPGIRLHATDERTDVWHTQPMISKRDTYLRPMKTLQEPSQANRL